MIIAETNPTPKPAMIRPTAKTAMVLEASWITTPIANTTQPVIIVVRRPIQSARSPAKRAPKKVPAERIETIKELFDEERTK
jgi:hypothetical protein